MRRLVLPLAAAVALGLTGCDYGSSHNHAAPSHQRAAALPAASPYTARMVQRAFARVGLPLTHNRAAESFVQESGGRSTLAAFLVDKTGNVQVSVYRPAAETSEPAIWVRALVEGGALPSVTKTRSNVSVTYPTRSQDAPRVVRQFEPRVLSALALLRSGYVDSSRYWQGDGICVVYHRHGVGADVREGTCPEDSQP